MNDFQKLTDFRNLYQSYHVSMRGKRNNANASKFSISALENLLLMKRQLQRHTYQISDYSEFVVTEPKQRVVKACSFRDKVLQHCLCDYVLLPKMQSVFIEDNYAGQIGKGTLFGLNRLSEKLTEHYRQYGNEGFLLKCDITKFFYRINHDTIKDIIAYHFPDEGIQWICNVLIDSDGEVGLPLGNQCSQVFALMYLDGLDHLVTDELGCTAYGRYMDDFFLISPSKEYLQYCLSAITEYVSSLHLELNNKTEIVPIKKGIRFLGFHTYLTDDGKVIRKLTGDNKRKVKKRLRKYAKQVQSGTLSREKFNEKYDAWKNHASHGNCYRLLCSMDKYVDGLFNNGMGTQV